MWGNLIIIPRDQGTLLDSWKLAWPWMCPFHAWLVLPSPVEREGPCQLPSCHEWEFALWFNTPKSLDLVGYIHIRSTLVHLLLWILHARPNFGLPKGQVPGPKSFQGQTTLLGDLEMRGRMIPRRIPGPPGVTRSGKRLWVRRVGLGSTMTVRLGRSLSPGFRPITCSIPNTSYPWVCPSLSPSRGSQLTRALGLSLISPQGRRSRPPPVNLHPSTSGLLFFFFFNNTSSML